MSNKKKRTQLSTAELLRLRSSIITMLDTANKSIQPERQVTLASAIEVANREIRKEVYGSNSTRAFSALRAVSGFIALSSKNKVSTSSLENSDLLSVGHPLSTRAHAMTASALRHARARWIAADDLIIDDDIRALVASAHSYEHGSFERKHAFARIAALGPGVVPITAAVDLEPIIAVLGFGLGGNSRAARSARARMQRRDRFGRFAFMGGGWKFNIFKSGKHSYVSGKVVGMSGVDDIEVEIKDDKNIPNGVYAVPAKKGQSAKAIIKKSYLKDTPEVAVSREDQKYAVNFSSMRKLDAPTGWTPTQASQPNHVAFMSADGYRVEIPINKDGQQEITGARKASVFRAVGNQKIGMADGWDSVELTALTDQDQYEKFLNSKQGQKLLSQGGWGVDVVQEDIGEDKFKPAGETTGPGDRPGPVPPAVQRMADEENKRAAEEKAQLEKPASQLEKADVKSVSVDWKTDGEPVTQEGLDAWKQEFAPGVDIKLQDDGSVKLTGSESNLRNALDKATDGDYNATDYIMDSAQLESMGVPTDRVLLDVEKMKNAVKGLTYKQLMDTGVKEYKMASKNVGAYWFTEDEVYDAEKDGFRLTGEERGGGKAMVDIPSYATPSGNLVDFAGDTSMSKIGAVMQAYRNGDVLRFKYNGKDREVQPSGNTYTNKKTGETNFVGFDHAIGEERTFTISKMDAPSPKKEAKKEKAKIITMPEADRGKAPQFIKPDSTPEEVVDQMQKAIDGQYPVKFGYGGKDRTFRPERIYTSPKTGKTNIVGFSETDGEGRTFTADKVTGVSTPEAPAGWDVKRDEVQPSAAENVIDLNPKEVNKIADIKKFVQDAIDNDQKLHFMYSDKDRVVTPEGVWQNGQTGRTNLKAKDSDGTSKNFAWDKIVAPKPSSRTKWPEPPDGIPAEAWDDLPWENLPNIPDDKELRPDQIWSGPDENFKLGPDGELIPLEPPKYEPLPEIYKLGPDGKRIIDPSLDKPMADVPQGTTAEGWDIRIAGMYGGEANAWTHIPPADEYGEDHSITEAVQKDGKSKFEVWRKGIWLGEGNNKQIATTDTLAEAAEAVKADMPNAEAIAIKNGKREPKATRQEKLQREREKFQERLDDPGNWEQKPVGIPTTSYEWTYVGPTPDFDEYPELMQDLLAAREEKGLQSAEDSRPIPDSDERAGAPSRPSAAPAGPAKMEKTKPGQPTLFAEPPEISPEIQRLVDAANDLRDTPTANLPAIIEKSIEEKKDVAFDFNDKLRVVTPEEIVENKAGKKQLKGFSKTDGEDRTFTIDKMNKPAADTNVKVDDIVNMPQDELDRLVDAAWPTPTAATPAYEEKVSEFDRQIADLNRKIETMKNVLNGPDSPDGKLHKRAKSNLDRLQQSKDKLSFDRINNNFEEKPAATTTRRLAVLPEGRSNEDIISEFEEDIPGGKARFTGDAQNGYPVFEFDIPAGEEERFNDWFGEDNIEDFPTGDAVAFAEKYNIPMGDNTELKNGNPGTSFEVDVAFEEGTLDDVLKDFKAKFPEGEADVVVSEGAGGGWPIVDFSVPEGREEDFGKWYNGDLADSDNIAGDLDEPVDENLFGGEPDAEDMGTFNDEAFDSMYTTPEGAYKPNIFEFYKPEGRTNQDSADYTDDPRVLSGKFSEDELVRALRDAVLPSDSGPANGYGNLPFESGDEPVKAEALFEALEQTGMDAGFLLAGIFDSASPDKSKKNQLNYVDTINTPPAGSPSAAIPLSDRLAQTRAAQAINGELGKPENAITAFRLINQHKETNPNIQDLAQELISRGINGLDLSQEGDADAQLARDLDTYLPWAFSESAEEREAFQSYWGLMLSIDGGDSDLEDWQHPGSRAIILDALERLTGGDGGKAMEMYYQLYEDFGGFKDLVDSKKAIADGVDDLESDTPAAGLFRLVAAAKEVSEIPLYRSIGVNANSELFKKYTTPGFVVSFDPRPFTETDLTTGEIGAVGFSPTNPNDVRIVFEVAAGEIDSVSLNGFSWYDQEQEHLGTGEFIVDSVREQPAVLKPGQNEYIITLKRATEDALKKAYGQPTEAEAPEVVEAPEAPTQGTAPREYGDVSDWKRVAGQAGSNQGGVYEDSEGNRYYVKTARSQDHADVETLGSALYRELGISATDVGLGTRDGALQIISPMIPNATSGMDDYINDPEFLGKLHEGFAIDAWLSNYDVIGMVYDNVVADGDGNPIRVDQGGVLVWRARGSRKEWFGPEVAELDSMRDPGMNPTASDVFGSMTAADIKKSGEKLLNITPSRIDEIVDSIVNSPKENELLKDMLKRRRQSILDQLGIKDTTVDPFAERVPLTESIGYAAQDLQPGDVAEGDSFVIERVFRDQMTPKNKVSVQGYFPGHESQRKEWNETTIIPVARGGTIPPKGDKPALHRPKAPRKPSPGAFTGKMAELLKDAKTWEEAAAIIRKTPIMFFDYESTGLPGPEKGGRNQPVQIGGTFVADGEVRAQFSSYMNPEHELSDWSAKNLKQMDGSPVTDEWLTTQPSMKDAHQQFLDFVKEHAGDEVILGGQYTPFDLEILQRVLSANGLSINIVGTIDSKDLAEGTLPKWNSKTQFGASQVSEKDGKRRASNSLGPVAEFLEVKLPDWHRADADAQASWEITDAMLTRAINNPDTTPTTLLNVDGAFEAKQQEIADYENAYAKYEADLAEYVAAKAIAASWNCGGAGLTAAVGPANGPCSVPSVEQMIREAQPLPIGEIDPDGVAGGSTSNESSMVDAQEIDTPSQDGVDTNDPYKDEQFKPTEEQRAILDAIMEGKNVVVQALAGTGKTATLLLAGKRKKKEAAQERGVYIAFNKSAQLEAEERFRKAGLTNIEVITNDAIATRWAPKDIVKKLDKNPELSYYKDIDKYLGITEFEGPGAQGYGLYEAHKFFMEAMRKYLISADPEIGPQHFDIPEQDVKPWMLDIVNKMWEDYKDPNGKLRMDNTIITKMWALSNPDLGEIGSGLKQAVDFIFFDEAQDINPVSGKVIADQTIQKVYVGDENQAIYAFRGGENQLGKVLGAVEFPLTKSWRFGANIANEGNKWLSMLESPYRVIGGNADPGELVPEESLYDTADAILVRTNSGGLSAIFDQLQRGRTVGVTKNYKNDLVNLTDSAEYLLNGGTGTKPKPMHPELAPFRTWAEVKKEAEDENSNASNKLKLFVGLVETEGIDGIRGLLDQLHLAKSTGAALKSVDIDDTDVGSEGSLGKGVDYTIDENGIGVFGNTFENKSTIAKNGFKWDKSKGQWRLETTNQDTISNVLKKLSVSLNGGVAPAEADAKPIDVFITTVHQAKGLEWDKVLIWTDFWGPRVNKATGEVEMPDPVEFRIAYVAVTRAKKQLGRGALSWIDSFVKQPAEPAPVEEPNAPEVPVPSTEGEGGGGVEEPPAPTPTPSDGGDDNERIIKSVKQAVKDADDTLEDYSDRSSKDEKNIKKFRQAVKDALYAYEGEQYVDAEERFRDAAELLEPYAEVGAGDLQSLMLQAADAADAIRISKLTPKETPAEQPKLDPEWRPDDVPAPLGVVPTGEQQAPDDVAPEQLETTNNNVDMSQVLRYKDDSEKAADLQNAFDDVEKSRDEVTGEDSVLMATDRNKIKKAAEEVRQIREALANGTMTDDQALARLNAIIDSLPTYDIFSERYVDMESFKDMVKAVKRYIDGSAYWRPTGAALPPIDAVDSKGRPAGYAKDGTTFLTPGMRVRTKFGYAGIVEEYEKTWGGVKVRMEIDPRPTEQKGAWGPYVARLAYNTRELTVIGPDEDPYVEITREKGSEKKKPKNLEQQMEIWNKVQAGEIDPKAKKSKAPKGEPPAEGEGGVGVEPPPSPPEGDGGSALPKAEAPEGATEAPDDIPPPPPWNPEVSETPDTTVETGDEAPAPEQNAIDPEVMSEMVDSALSDMHATLHDQIRGMSATLVKMPVNETMMSIANVAGRPIVLVNINGVSVPFYASTGSGGKTSVPTNKWYPIFGISPQTSWFNKGFTEEQINNMYDSPELKAVADFLNANLANPLAMVPDIPKAAGEQEYQDLLAAINTDMDTTSGSSAKSAKILKQNIESTVNDIKTPVIRTGWDPTLFRSGDQSTWPRFLLMADGITSRQDVAAAVRHGIEMIFERQEDDVRSQEEINKNAGAYFALLDQAIKENASDMYLGGDFDNSKKMKQLAEDWDFARPSLMNLDMFIDQMLNASTDPQVKKWKDRIQYMDATEESDYRLSLREGARLVTSDKIKLHGKSNSEVTPAGRPPVVIKDPKPISSSGLTGIPSLMEAVSTVVDRPDQYKERGVSAAVDSTDIEDLDIRASTIITPDGERKLRLRFKLTSWRGAEVTQEISSNLGQAGSLFRAEAPQIERVSVAENGDIVLSGESVVNNWGGAVFNNGRMFVSDSEDTGNPWSINIMRANDDNSLEPLDAQYESAPAAFHNQVIIDLPIDAEQSDIEEALRAAGVRDVRAAQQQDTKSLIENRLLSLFDSQTDPNINITDQDRRDKKLEKIKERWGVEAADVFPRIGSHGRIEYMLPDNVAFLMQEDTGIKGFKHNLSLEKAVANLVDTQSRPPTPEELIQVTTNAIVDVVTNGLVATVSRVQEGLNYKGMSSTEDLWTGGADYVFLRPTKHDENSTLEVMGGFNANSEGSIWWPATDIFERSDLYANIDDLYGKRVPGTDILRAVKYEGQEAMVKHGVPITKDAQIVVSQLVRDRAIKMLKERGITEIDGTPIEEIILTAGSKILEDRRGSKDSAKGQLLRFAEENLTEAFTEAGGSETVDFNDLAAMLTYTGSDLHYQPAPAGSVAVAAKYMFTVDMGLDPFEIENTRQLPQIIVRYPDGHYYTHDAGSAGAVLSGDAYVEPMLASDVNVLRNKVAEYNSPFDRQEEEGKVDWLPFSGNHAVTNAGGYDTMLRAEIVIPFGQENAGNPTGEDYADILDRYKLVDEIIKKVAKMKSFEMYSAARGMLLPMYANTRDRNLQSYIMQQLINLTLYTGRTVPPMPVTSAGEEKDTNMLPLPDYDEFAKYGNYLNRAGTQAVLENVDGEYAGWLRAAYSAKIIRDFDDQGLPIRSYMEITTDRDGGLSFQLKENSGFKWDPNKREITFSSRGIMYKIRAIQPDEKLNRIQL
jgi:DNA polymerase III epsilon subunit-like protein/predicted DNA-binding transcriptional regulator YafY